MGLDLPRILSTSLGRFPSHTTTLSLLQVDVADAQLFTFQGAYGLFWSRIPPSECGLFRRLVVNGLGGSHFPTPLVSPSYICRPQFFFSLWVSVKVVSLHRHLPRTPPFFFFSVASPTFLVDFSPRPKLCARRVVAHDFYRRTGRVMDRFSFSLEHATSLSPPVPFSTRLSPSPTCDPPSFLWRASALCDFFIVSAVLIFLLSSFPPEVYSLFFVGGTAYDLSRILRRPPCRCFPQQHTFAPLAGTPF